MSELENRPAMPPASTDQHPHDENQAPLKKGRRSNTKKRTDSKPAFGTQEWTAHNVNIQKGCERDCKYCFAKSNAIRFRRCTPASWSRDIEIDPKKLSKTYRLRDGRFMFPTSHDITVRNVEPCIAALKRILEPGNEVTIVMKPTLSAVTRLCDELTAFKDRILFRFTIGSLDEEVIRYWDVGAPSAEQRLECLELAYRRGYATSVSIEPMLDTNPHAIIEATRPFVTDSIWLGRANNLNSIVAINCPGDEEAKRRARELLHSQPDEWLVGLYERYKDDPLIRFKDSIKKAAGIEQPIEKGLDV